MSLHTTEEEELEAMKQWWKENGTAVLLGTALGFGLLFGWRGWQTYQYRQAEEASLMYEQVMAHAQQDKTQELDKARERLLSAYPNSSYAVLASLTEASKKVQAGQSEVAKVTLQWVIDNASLPEIKQVARLRKARLLADSQDYSGALALLNAVDAAAFKSAVAEIQGDIFMAQGQLKEAAAAYDKVLADTMGQQDQHRSLVQLKRDSLGLTETVIAAADSVPKIMATPAADKPANPETAPTTVIEPVAESAPSAPVTPAPVAPAEPVSATPVVPAPATPVAPVAPVPAAPAEPVPSVPATPAAQP